MRLLGLGQSAVWKWKSCGFVDLPKPVVKTMYDAFLWKINTAAKNVDNVLMRKATDEKKQWQRYFM